jgi:predicted RNA-binding protein with PUA-like domain
MSASHWVVKQEPEAYSWDQFARDGLAAWTGVRNYQARNNLRAMKKGDFVLYYHSLSEKRVVGLASVAREHYPDPTATEGDWSAVDLKPLRALKTPVTLDQLKTDPFMKDLLLVRNSRISVSPVPDAQFRRIMELADTRV